MTTPDEFRLLGFTAEDAADAARIDADPDAVAALTDRLRKLVGVFGESQDAELTDELVSIAAFLQTLPDIRRFHAEQAISDEVSWATLADLGRQVAINRRTLGRFGLETHWWLTCHWAGTIYQLGRLQFLLYRETKAVPGVEAGEWVVGVHIPETGSLDPAAIDDSFRQAVAFFAEHFPDKPVRTATLHSWLLDPYLVQHLPAGSNMVRFARRFTLTGETADDQGSAVYFTFRTRDLDQLDRLPRDTTLQRLVLDRIAAGGRWQNAFGYLRL